MYLCDVKISDGGVNYDKDFDTISVTPDNGAVLEPEFGPEGKLIGIKILKNGFGFTERPIITVNTTTGVNAKIDTVLCVNRLDDDEEAASRILPEEVITVIENYEPRVDIIEVIVKPNYDEGAMDVSIQYEVVGINVPAQELTLALEPTR